MSPTLGCLKIIRRRSTAVSLKTVEDRAWVSILTIHCSLSVLLSSLFGPPWWRNQMETFSALLALCAGNSPVPVNSPHKGQWRGALMFSLICGWINNWVNNREAGDLRRHRGHFDVIVMRRSFFGLPYFTFRHCGCYESPVTLSTPSFCILGNNVYIVPTESRICLEIVPKLWNACTFSNFMICMAMVNWCVIWWFLFLAPNPMPM